MGMTVDAGHFRHVMGHFATGVTVVSGLDPDGNPVGLTANAVTSVSLEPRLLLVGMDRGSSSLEALLETGQFGISVLRAEDEALARRFAEEAPGVRFRGLDLEDVGADVPILRGALAWLACSVWRTVEAGDHTLLLGEVVKCSADTEGRPLVFFRGGYGTVAP
jgi:3-hydroxy-9,10-secoandrosta-1,3,5(10)-triene-9,17-dione monooxygenase reductase component